MREGDKEKGGRSSEQGEIRKKEERGGRGE